MRKCPNCGVKRVKDDSPIKICTKCQEAKKRWYKKKHGDKGQTKEHQDKFIRKAF